MVISMTATATVAHNAADDHTLGYLLADTVRLMRRDFAARAHALKLTPALARLLFYVARDPGSHQSELAARLEVTAATLGRMVDRLVERGYLKRIADSGDRRAFRVYLDCAAEPLLGEMSRIGKLTEARACDGLTDSERTLFIAQLARLRSNLADSGA
jgi:DNA-binding MarR family transcriptional regulator